MQGASFEKFRRWSVLSLMNLCIVSVLGVLLRYKIVFSLPAINYNFLLQAHTHFAFSGWISTAIFTAFVYLLSRSGYPIGKTYTFQFRLAQISSFGMLLSFPFTGYGLLSIFFSILFILFSWWFALQYWKDVSKSDLPFAVKRWVKAALFFFVLSSLGILLLAYIGSHRINAPDLYYNALYLFLHFQYNGWFSFGVLTLFFYSAHHFKLRIDENRSRLFFWLLAAACIPAYCLSLLWMNPPVWVFTIAAVAAFLQLGGLAVFFLIVSRSWGYWTLMQFQEKLLLGLSFIAFMLKLILQALSVIPALGMLAFGFRSVIIVYLHLVMLVFISFFLVGFFIIEKLFYPGSGVWKKGLTIFITGIILNEVILLIQALSAMNNGIWSSASFLLFIAASIIFVGVLLMLTAQVILKKNGKYQIPVSD